MTKEMWERALAEIRSVGDKEGRDACKKEELGLYNYR